MKTFTVNTNEDVFDLQHLLAAGERPDRIVAFKYVRRAHKESKRCSPYEAGQKRMLTYPKGETISVRKFDKSSDYICAAGIHVASKEWCREDRLNWDEPKSAFLTLKVEVLGDIVMPGHTDGKFRTNRVKVLT